MSGMKVFEKFYLLRGFPFSVWVDAAVPRVARGGGVLLGGGGRLSGPGHTNENGGAKLALPDRVKYFEIKRKYERHTFWRFYSDHRCTRFQSSQSA